jgi:hypothetical protein
MIDPSDETLRALYAAHAANSPDTPHPDPDRLADAALGRGSAELRLAVFDHALTCASCRQDLELLQTTADTGRMLRQRAFRTRLILAAAAAVVVAVGLTIKSGWQKDLGPSQAAESERGASVNNEGRTAIDLVSPIGAVPQGTTLNFVWRSVPGVTSYTVEVVGGSGLVLRSDAHDTLLARPPLPGGRYQWRVSATTPDGTVWRSPFTELRTSP